ncbi:MAG: molybdate transport system permease protein [Deferribacteres bacterium]|jgi:molybdate transport system permease protein|nr:molybdate transporter, inner rane subunit [Deferribacteraceae bacterium]MDK2792234.1 molybdate transport system permease protein [Deferribacteres bacterium]
MESEFISTLTVTFKLAFYTTSILLVIGLIIVYILSNDCQENKTFKKLKPLIETLVTLPIVLPPSVIGFYLLIIFSPRSKLGKLLNETFDFSLAFTFEGIVLASVFFSLPFMINPIYNAINLLPASLKEASYSLGKSRLTTFLKVQIPCIKNNIISASAITFAHTIGEFGIVLMVGGNIPNETKVASIAIYDEFESLNFTMAHKYSITLFLLSFALLLTIYFINRRISRI